MTKSVSKDSTEIIGNLPDIATILGADEGLIELLERAPQFSAQGLIQMVFAHSPTFSASERQLVLRLSSVIIKSDKEVAAELAAAALLEKLKLKSIFANFLHCLYHSDKELEVLKKELQRNGEEIFAHERAKTAVRAKLSLDKDGKQAARLAARQLWLDWQKGKTRHKSAAAFHRFVVQSLPVITSTETVKKWAKGWREEQNGVRAS